MEKVRPISLMIAIFLLALVLSYHIYYSFSENVNEVLVETYLEKESTEEISTNNVEKIISKPKDQIKGVLEIPKIKLKKGFYDINSKENNVNKNVTMLKGSSMPDIKNTALFLAAHNGDSAISFFNKIDLLKIDDSIIIHYNNVQYYYSVSDIYEMNKNGQISVNKNIHENILVLTTCSKKKDKQLVIVSKLIDVM